MDWRGKEGTKDKRKEEKRKEGERKEKWMAESKFLWMKDRKDIMIDAQRRKNKRNKLMGLNRWTKRRVEGKDGIRKE